MELQRRNEEWGPVTVLPLFLLGNHLPESRRVREKSGEGVLCSAYSGCLHGPPGLSLPKSSFQHKYGIVGSFEGWTFKVHLVQPPLPCSGTSSSRSGCSRPRPTWFWTLWIAPRLLWPFSLLRLTELTGSVARSLCKTFFHFFLFSSFIPNRGSGEGVTVWLPVCSETGPQFCALLQQQYLCLTVL